MMKEYLIKDSGTLVSEYTNANKGTHSICALSHAKETQNHCDRLSEDQIGPKKAWTHGKVSFWHLIRLYYQLSEK